MNYLGVLFNFLNIYKVFSRPCKALLLHPEWSDIFEVLYGDWLKLLAREQRVKCDTRWKHSQKTTSRSLFWCLHCELRAYFMQYSGSTQKEKNRKALKHVIILIIWIKVFKNGSSKICGRQPLKNLKWYGLLRVRPPTTNFTWPILEYLDPYVVSWDYISFCASLTTTPIYYWHFDIHNKV